MSIDKTPSELQETHDKLFQKVVALHHKWNEWQALFAGTVETVELLDKTAPAFFAMHQRVLIDDIILSMARLLDPAETGAYENLSLYRLQDCANATGNSKLSTDFGAAFETFKKHSESLKIYRNKRLGHNDLDTIREIDPLPPVTVQDIKNSLGALQDVMNTVDKYFGKSGISYELVRRGPHGVDAIVLFLKEGLQYHEEEKKKRKW